MFCPECGSTVKENDRICSNCGSFNPNYRPAPTPQPPKKNNTVLYVLLGVIVLLALVIIGLLTGLLLSSKEASQPAMPTEAAKEEPQEPATTIIIIHEEKEEEPVVPKQPKSYKKVSSYESVKSNATWSTARQKAEAKGGTLVCINDEAEFNKVCKIADNKGIKVFWVGAERDYYENWSSVYWLDSTRMNYTRWLPGEPSYVSEDGTDEYFLIVFKVNGKWYFNDAPHDIEPFYSGKMGYIIEYENLEPVY
ncbi:MAG: hypothetical protein IJC69_08205 [Clostridia bacterium]|nr:hypothetical protein [Clostridia bacterium]